MAISDRDRDALLRWAGSQASYDDGLLAFERTVFLQRPTSETHSYEVVDVLLDRPDCVVTVDRVTVDAGVIEDYSGGTSTTIQIWWPAEDGRFTDGATWQDGTPQSSGLRSAISKLGE